MLEDNADKFDLVPIAREMPISPGAPPKPIDVEDFRKLCQLQCTVEEIAAFFGVSTRTIKRRLKEDLFRDVWDEGRAQGKISLRRRMFASTDSRFKSGAQAGCYTPAAVTMQVHLSKQWLGMTDKAAVEHSGKIDGPAPVAAAAVIIQLPDNGRGQLIENGGG